MGIEFARSHVLSRSAGHSAVKAAAYRSGEKLHDERTGRTADYSHRSSDVLSAQILLPEGADEKFLDRETLWSAVEDREDQHNRRASAQLAKDHIIALPRELNDVQRQALAESFAVSEFVSKGLVVDMAIHAHSDGNPHAHLLTTTRVLDGAEFGKKLREANGNFYGGTKIRDAEQLRHRWADHQNAFFKEHGIDAFVTNHNGEYQAEKHLGAAHEMHKKGQGTELFDTVEATRSARVQAIMDRPEIIIHRVADKKAVFTKHDLYRELHKVVSDADSFKHIKAKIDAHESIVRMESAHGQPFLTTLDTLKTEQSIRDAGGQLSAKDKHFSIKDSLVNATLARYSFLSDEQVNAVKHLTGSERLGLVMGLAGAGKSTMLDVVRQVNEASGHRVHGIALAGKAADELEKSSGISSRTISSFLYGLKSGNVEINKGDVIVVDEFGMVSNAQADAILSHAVKAGAKVIGVGDTEQLQSIQTGAALRDLSQRHGFASIETIRRQSERWQRDATFALAKGASADAINAYREHGNLHVSDTGSAVNDLVSAYLSDERMGSKAVLAHRTADVKALNEHIREGLKRQGLLKNAAPFQSHSGRDEQRIVFDLEKGDEVVFNASDAALGLREHDRGTFVGHDNGEMVFVHDDGRELSFQPERYSDIDIADKKDTAITIDLAEGDRVLFTRNDNELEVKNGQLGTLISFERDQLSVQMDSGKVVRFSQQDYSDISHGYATTVHKSQGMTVDHSYVLGTQTMDKHLAYVALSRHRESTAIYTDNEPAFVLAASRENRQETALDFAERHDLTLVSAHRGDVLDRILSGQVVSDEIKIDRVSSISGKEATHAQKVFDAELSRRIIELTATAQNEQLAPLQRKLEELDGALRQHRDNAPQPGLFKTNGFKERVADWEHQRQVKEAERGYVSRQIERIRSGSVAEHHQEMIAREARKLATQSLPKESELIANHEADKQLVRLTDELSDINKQLDQARERGESKVIPRLLNTQSRLLSTLHHKKSVNSRLSDKQKVAVAGAKRTVDKELKLIRGRDRGLGL
jgi:Ti-type conjugative transfer relaxase TraA